MSFIFASHLDLLAKLVSLYSVHLDLHALMEYVRFYTYSFHTNVSKPRILDRNISAVSQGTSGRALMKKKVLMLTHDRGKYIFQQHLLEELCCCQLLKVFSWSLALKNHLHPEIICLRIQGKRLIPGAERTS